MNAEKPIEVSAVRLVRVLSLANAFVLYAGMGLLLTAAAKVSTVFWHAARLPPTDAVFRFLPSRILIVLASLLEFTVVGLCFMHGISLRMRLAAIFALASTFALYRILFYAVSGRLLGCPCLGGFGFTEGQWVQIPLLLFLGYLWIGSGVFLCLDAGHSSEAVLNPDTVP